jgi:hypothetical protein
VFHELLNIFDFNELIHVFKVRMNGRGTAVPHFFIFFCCENAAKMHGRRLLRRERRRSARIMMFFLWKYLVV